MEQDRDYPGLTERAKLDMLRLGLSIDEVQDDFLTAEELTGGWVCRSAGYIYFVDKQFFLDNPPDDVVRLGRVGSVIKRIFKRDE